MGLLDVFDDVLVEPLMPDCAVVALDVGILLRLSGLDMQDGNPMFLGPFHQLFTDVFRAIVDPDRKRPPALCNDAIKRTDDARGWQ